MQNLTNNVIPALTSEESAALVNFARQLELEDGGDEIAIEDIAARTQIPLERLLALINSGKFPSANFSEKEATWYMPMSEWNMSGS